MITLSVPLWGTCGNWIFLYDGGVEEADSLIVELALMEWKKLPCWQGWSCDGVPWRGKPKEARSSEGRFCATYKWPDKRGSRRDECFQVVCPDIGEGFLLLFHGGRGWWSGPRFEADFVGSLFAQRVRECVNAGKWGKLTCDRNSISRATFRTYTNKVTITNTNRYRICNIPWNLHAPLKLWKTHNLLRLRKYLHASHTIKSDLCNATNLKQSWSIQSQVPRPTTMSFYERLKLSAFLQSSYNLILSRGNYRNHSPWIDIVIYGQNFRTCLILHRQHFYTKKLGIILLWFGG